MPVRFFVTEGTCADCTKAIELIEKFKAEYLLADRGYDVDELIEYARQAGIEVVIPPKKNRKEKREYKEYLYKFRHLIENTNRILKEWRGIATRYAKRVSSFTAAVEIRCMMMWAHIL